MTLSKFGNAAEGNIGTTLKVGDGAIEGFGDGITGDAAPGT